MDKREAENIENVMGVDGKHDGAEGKAVSSVVETEKAELSIIGQRLKRDAPKK